MAYLNMNEASVISYVYISINYLFGFYAHFYC